MKLMCNTFILPWQIEDELDEAVNKIYEFNILAGELDVVFCYCCYYKQPQML